MSSFERITGKDDIAIFRSKRARHIRGARIATAILQNIDALTAGDDHGKTNGAEQIADDGNDRDGETSHIL